MSRSYRTYPGRIFRPPKGMCRFCGLIIWLEDGAIDRSKEFCGPVCRTEHNLRADPQKMREHVFFRDKGKCAECGFVHPYLDGEWEVDHILPLAMAFGNPDYWNPTNTRCLCIVPCHQIKTAADARKYQRKFRRRIAEILASMDGD